MTDANSKLGEWVQHVMHEDVMLMERQFRLVLQPRPRWLPEWVWWRVLRRLLVIEERR